MAADPGLALRAALKKGPIMVPGTYDAITALLIQKSGFPAAFVTGAGLSVSVLGKPDIGLLTLTDVAEVVRRMTAAVKIPLIVDADTGYGGELNVARAVREFERAGAAAIQIEDQVFPKRCGHLMGKSVTTPEEMIAKIAAARAARTNKNFVIVARTDARATGGVADALKRAAAYKRAGADVIFPEALESEREFRAFGSKKGLGWLMANMTEFGRSPILSAAELARLGFRLILYPMTAFRTAAFAVEEALGRLKADGHNRGLLDRMQTRQELYALNGYSEFDRREDQYLLTAERIVGRQRAKSKRTS